MATKVKTAKTYRKEITKSVGVIHDEIINISDELVEGTISAASKWQKLWAKAIKNSEPMVSKQIDMMYDTLKTVKSQMKVSGKRIKGLISEDVEIPTINVTIPTLKVKTSTKGAATKATKVVKKVVAKAKAATTVDAKKTKAKTATKRKATSTAKRKATAPRKIRTVKADNLKLIEGIGPKLETILLENGIITFKDLSKAKVATLRTILEKAGPRYNVHNPSTWAKQARFAANGKMADLKKYQGTLNNKK